MGPSHQTSGLLLTARIGAAVAICLVVANCGKSTSRIDPRYGVSASKRVIEPGQPVPKGGGVYRVGKPYVIAGKTYVPEENENYRGEGIASWYGDDFHGRRTANGEIFDMATITAAHPTLPIPSYARVTNLKNRRSVIVRVNDRGPYAHDRIIDLSARAAKLLEFHGKGVARVRVEYVGKAPLSGSDDVKLASTLRENGRPVGGGVTEVAAAVPQNFERELLDPTPGIKPGGQVPMPMQRPYRLGQVQVAAVEPVQSVAAPQPESAPDPRRVRSASLEAPMSVTSSSPETLAPRSLGTLRMSGSQVSAYAAPRYDGSTGLMSGRGLY